MWQALQVFLWKGCFLSLTLVLLGCPFSPNDSALLSEELCWKVAKDTICQMPLPPSLSLPPLKLLLISTEIVAKSDKVKKGETGEWMIQPENKVDALLHYIPESCLAKIVCHFLWSFHPPSIQSWTIKPISIYHYNKFPFSGKQYLSTLLLFQKLSRNFFW